VADEKTLEALIVNRYEVMAGYARELQRAVAQEIARLPQQPAESVLKVARRWMHRDADKVPSWASQSLEQARAVLPDADTMVRMREELRQLWLSTHRSRDQLASDLQAWCRKAEGSGVAALQEFSLRLRMARL
jgi:stearoyl-CoA desaturase (delta-9 desaturase)